MLLQTHQLTKDYGRFRALDALTLSISAGEVFGLLGPNGSGKTTALRLLLGFLRPTAGTGSGKSAAVVTSPAPTSSSNARRTARRISAAGRTATFSLQAGRAVAARY